MGNFWLDIIMESFGYLVSQRNGCSVACGIWKASAHRDSLWCWGGLPWGVPGSAAPLGCFTLQGSLWGQLWGARWGWALGTPALGL